MHIALNGWFWDRQDTGSGQYLRQLTRALRKVDSGLKLTLVMPPHNPQPDDLPDGVEIMATGRGGRSSRLGKIRFEQWTFPRAAERLSADLAHVPYWGSPLSASLPVVVSVLDIIPLMMPEYAMGVGNRLYVSLVSAAARAADHVITISYTSQIDIEEWLDIPRERISVTYLAPDERFHPVIGSESDEAVRRRYDLPDRFVLYLGGFDRRKQVNELMLAYTYVGEAEGDRIPLVVAGREPQWSEPLFPNLRRYADQLAINDYVRWIGFVDEADKAALLRLADVFVWPSEYEGFGIPPLEAMACGTPVVAWNSIVADEVLQDGAYLVEDSRGMAGAILGLLLQQPFYETMVNQARAQVTKYSWRKTARATLEAYEATLRSSSRNEG